MTEEELRQKIRCLLLDNEDMTAGGDTEVIFNWFRQANYVRLADDQSLPDAPDWLYDEGKGRVEDYERGQQDTLKVQEKDGKKYAFRRVEVDAK